MPRPKKVQPTMVYTSMRSAGDQMGERNDCAVIALAIVCGVSYEKAWSTLNELGRRKRGGTFRFHTLQAIKSLGKRLERVHLADMIASYPKPHRNVLKSVTTHHPARFPKAWKDGRTYLIFTSTHALAVQDGVCHDWSASNALRVEEIFEVVDETCHTGENQL